MSLPVLDLLRGELRLSHAVLAQLVLKVLQHRLLLDKDRNRVLAIDLPNVAVSENKMLCSTEGAGIPYRFGIQMVALCLVFQ